MLARIKQIAAAPAFENDEEKTRHASLLNVILIVGALLVGGSLLFRTAAGFIEIGSATFNVLFLVFAVIVGLMFLLRRGQVQASSLILVVVFWSALVFLAWNATGVYDTALIGTLVIVLMATLLLGWQVGLVIGVFSIMAAWLLAYSQVSNLLAPVGVIPAYRVALDLTVIIALASILLTLATAGLRQALNRSRRANVELRQIQTELEVRVIERTRDLELAAEVGRSLSQVLDVEALLRSAVDRVQARFDLYYAQIYLVDESEKSLVLRAGTGTVGEQLRARGHQLPFNAGSINGAAAVNREPVLVADTTTSAFFRTNSLLPDTRSELAVPLTVGKKVVGVLDLQSSVAGALSQDNLTAFEILAGQLAIAIENARLLRDTIAVREELEQRIRTDARQAWDHYLDAIQRGEQIGYRYDHGDLKRVAGDADEEALGDGRQLDMPIVLAGETIGHVRMAVDDAQSDIWSHDELELVSSVTDQISQQIENLRLLDEAERYRQDAIKASSRLIREGWGDFNEEHPAAFAYEKGQVHSEELSGADEGGAFISAPLQVQSETIGQLELSGVELDEEQTAVLLASVAQQLSAHIENLRLNEQTEDALAEARQRSTELNLLNEMGVQFAAARETGEILTIIYAYANRLIPFADNLLVALYDEAVAELTYHRFFDENRPAADGTVQMTDRRPAANGIIEHVLSSRRPLLVDSGIDSAAAASDFEIAGESAQSWLGVPMIVGERPLGVIVIQHGETPNLYNDHHRDLLTAVANSAGISLESVRLLQQVQSRARQEQILREVTAHVHAAVDAESILRTTAQELNRRLGLETFVYLEETTESDERDVDNGQNGNNRTNGNH